MISVVILSKNSEKTIRKTLSSVKNFEEVILLDTGSTDSTLQIAEKFPNVKIFSSIFCGFGKLKNKGAAFAKNDWILSLDSDESLSPALIKELDTIALSSDTVYSFPFQNFYKGKLVKCCGWYPESHIRLYNRKITSFSSSCVHEGIETKDLQIKVFTNPIFHTPYNNIDDFLRKMQLYSTLFAEQNRGRKKSSFLKAFIHGSAAFFKGYFLQKGIFYGSTGFIIASYNASTAFYKYLKLAEINRKT